MVVPVTENKAYHEKFIQFFKFTYSALRTSAFTETRYKLAIYWLIVVVGSFIQDFFPPPSSYLSYTRNVFNVYFVKLGWGWTWTLLSLLLIMTSSILTSGNVLLMARHYGRLIVATIAWFLWMNFFEYIEHLSGSCKGDSRHSSKYTCRTNGYFWQGFDISGHAFLLIHCSLTISEEIKVVKLLEDLEKKSSMDQGSPSTGPLTFNSKYWCKLLTPFINVTFLCAALLMILWEVILVSTSLYFHTVQQKILGAFAAFITWILTYKYWFVQDSAFILPIQSYFNKYDIAK